MDVPVGECGCFGSAELILIVRRQMQFGSECFSLNIACTLYTYPFHARVLSRNAAYYGSSLIRMLLAENVEWRYRR
jgi:hypothetical protein